MMFFFLLVPVFFSQKKKGLKNKEKGLKKIALLSSNCFDSRYVRI